MKQCINFDSRLFALYVSIPLFRVSLLSELAGKSDRMLSVADCGKATLFTVFLSSELLACLQ